MRDNGVCTIDGGDNKEDMSTYGHPRPVEVDDDDGDRWWRTDAI